jgi:hypothetical protein
VEREADVYRSTIWPLLAWEGVGCT